MAPRALKRVHTHKEATPIDFENVEREARAVARRFDEQHYEVADRVTQRIVAAFGEQRVTDSDFQVSTGYGYDAPGRAKLEAIFARAFGTEGALVRTQWATGTHALTSALFATLRPGDELLLATGEPYDTLRPVLEGPTSGGSLQTWGIAVRRLSEDPLNLSPEVLRTSIGPRTRVVYFQRSRGYQQRAALSAARLSQLANAAAQSGCVTVVDNCYGEFVEDSEPCADLVVGSLLKNPGGALARTGAYVAGRNVHLEAVADRLYAPGLHGAVGPLVDEGPRLLQGLFMAPQAVHTALVAAVYAAALFQGLGFTVDPLPAAPRGDIIQSIVLGDEQRLLRFTSALQASMPISGHARPEASALPGYSDRIIMAQGGFVQGASLELSADAPLRPPFAVYLQGGVQLMHSLHALRQVARDLSGMRMPPAE